MLGRIRVVVHTPYRGIPQEERLSVLIYGSPLVRRPVQVVGVRRVAAHDLVALEGEFVRQERPICHGTRHELLRVFTGGNTKLGEGTHPGSNPGSRRKDDRPCRALGVDQPGVPGDEVIRERSVVRHDHVQVVRVHVGRVVDDRRSARDAA